VQPAANNNIKRQAPDRANLLNRIQTSFLEKTIHSGDTNLFSDFAVRGIRIY
jgi:hypothetical protein